MPRKLVAMRLRIDVVEAFRAATRARGRSMSSAVEALMERYSAKNPPPKFAAPQTSSTPTTLPKARTVAKPTRLAATRARLPSTKTEQPRATAPDDEDEEDAKTRAEDEALAREGIATGDEGIPFSRAERLEFLAAKRAHDANA